MQSLTPNLMVANVNETLTYYQQNFGLHTIATVPEKGDLDWAMGQMGSVILMFQSESSLKKDLKAMENMQMGGTLNFYIKVLDIKTLYDSIKEKVKIVSDLQRTFYNADEFTIQDLNGYFLTFAQDAE